MNVRRAVFWIGGFDPTAAGQLARRFRSAVRHQASLPGYAQVHVEAKPRQSGGSIRWTTHWQSPEGQAVCDMQVWDWGDVVRAHWHRDLFSALRSYLRYYVGGWRQRLFQRVWPVAPATCLLGLFPLAMLVGWLLCGLLCGWAASALLFEGRHPAQLLLLGLGLSTVGWRLVERRLDFEWLIRLYGFTSLMAGQGVPALEQRLEGFVDVLLEALDRLDDPKDPACPTEVLVVGHSTGSLLAASVVARALARREARGAAMAPISLLTLGHCTPAVAFFDGAHAFRAELSRLCAHRQLTWLDVSSPGDWAAFHHVPPWLGVASGRVRQVSPRFHKVLFQPHFEQIRRRPLLRHLQYLAPIDVPGGYDLVALTAGPHGLSVHLPGREVYGAS